jgi:hypothetical protein
MKLNINFDMHVNKILLEDLKRLGINEFSDLLEDIRIDWIGNNSMIEVENKFNCGVINEFKVNYTVLEDCRIEYLQKLKSEYPQFFGYGYSIIFPIELFNNDEDYYLNTLDSGSQYLTFKLTLNDLCRIVYGYIYDSLENKINQLVKKVDCCKENIKNQLDYKTMDIEKIRSFNNELEELLEKLEKLRTVFHNLRHHNNVVDYVEF